MVNKFKIPKFKRFQYDKSPIKEALIEVKFRQTSENSEPTVPGQFFEAVKKEFPTKKSLNILSFTIGASGVSSSQETGPAQAPVLQTWDSEEGNLLQVGPGILTSNSVKYKHWESFFKNFNFGLEKFLGLVPQIQPERIGVRYINRFLLTGDSITLGEYFNFGFALPDQIGSPEGFRFSLEKNIFSFENLGAVNTRINFGTDRLRPNEQGLPILLDIDCYLENFDKVVPTSEMCEAIDFAHEVAELIFESFITDKTRVDLGGRGK